MRNVPDYKARPSFRSTSVVLAYGARMLIAERGRLSGGNRARSRLIARLPIRSLWPLVPDRTIVLRWGGQRQDRHGSRSGAVRAVAQARCGPYCLPLSPAGAMA